MFPKSSGCIHLVESPKKTFREGRQNFCITFKWTHQTFFLLGEPGRLNQVATIRCFLLVKVVTLAAHHLIVVSRDVPYHLPQPVGSKAKKIFSTEKSIQCHSLFFFRCKVPSGSAKTAATAASTLVSFAPAGLTVASCFSCSSFSFESILQKLFKGFNTTKKRLTGYGRPHEN